ncbi:2,3-bisphosphoglycerate-independent phosphoglycerate mutase [Thermobrachium celere]|uniref:2,3-bisphosphoglycerate-independent phosphoglycerate mutase n=1 Tax=Thermobrachium celere DSM 8682 TaxID=941824 RepID=R7RTN7_9CLOT|nr:2,3-bisphosphoglycerate-independent phosphoglycerate mutase [Thermobrachium celere]GFR35489.1 2,3-bisphosphoglycerate-independent phosphoglycerate mutase [Thermobrachium celere]CDF58653.1 2,3-bisphosphoglycerate-independent phosphoglycerate mutase [Thermobrachium celere DSM 8682]
MQKKPVMLMILDGWGINEKADGNAIASANKPNFDRLWNEYPHTKLSASGLDVGLPRGQMGNSEVGHLNIGAGRIIYQEYTRINKEIEEGGFFKNDAFIKAIENAKNNNSDVHLMGLLSDGGVHSHIDHLEALIKLCKDMDFNRVFVHAFLDGRDVPPSSALEYVDRLEKYMKEIGVGKIATISGRYYSMDRDKRWERTKLAYDAMVNAQGEIASSAREAIEKSYSENRTDEFVLPTVIIENERPVARIKENDSVIFFNFRPDRARQITRALVDVEFTGFERNYFKVYFVCMTQYDKTIENVDIAYRPEVHKNTFGEYIASKGLKQLRIAETEKYAHVTFFFNGGVEAPNKDEDRILIPSPKVATYDLQPEMSAYLVADRVCQEIDKDIYDVIILNFANPDMVGHTGVFDAAKKAVEAVDECIGKVVAKIREKGGTVLITADHGNAEMMVDYETGEPYTAHTTNLVPFIVVGDEKVDLRDGGRLCDIAPTMLDIMGIDIPVEMTGKSLIIK